MDLLEAAELLLEKVKLYNTPNSPAQKTFRLREEVRAIAMQIPCLLEGPEQAMHTVARQYTVCSALKICADLELAAKMPIDQPQTLDELARATSCDSRILRPVLRILAQNGIFSQDQDGNWQHTAMSKVITQAPFRAWLNSILEEKYQSSAQLPAFLSRNAYEMPSTGKAAYNSVYQTPLDFYTYANEKDHAVSQNFAVSMRELARTQLPFIVECYPFHDLPPETRFIDIAGGEGNLCFYLAKRLPHATFQLQDHITVVAQAENSYDTSLGGRIDFKAQDMYLPQPPIDRETYKNGAVFLLKIILHDHDDMQCRLILNNIIASMKYGDRLLIMETVLPEVGGSLSSSMSDMIILSMFGCGHRTLNEWLELIHGSGEVHTEVYGEGSSEFDGMMIFEVTLPDTRP